MVYGCWFALVSLVLVVLLRVFVSCYLVLICYDWGVLCVPLIVLLFTF